METAKLTSKGQIVIPKRIRDAVRAKHIVPSIWRTLHWHVQDSGSRLCCCAIGSSDCIPTRSDHRPVLDHQRIVAQFHVNIAHLLMFFEFLKKRQ